jgi:uncharacterized protein involved in response to NO
LTRATPDHGAPTDPYRIFFPLGIVLGVAGVAIWLAYGLGWTSRYSGRAHAFVQAEGFLYAFIAGFLLTAVPRFTGTAAPSRAIQVLLAAGLAASAAAFELQAFAAGHALFLAVHLGVMALAVRRVRRRQSAPPPGFVLVGLGMMAGAAGAAVCLGVASGGLSPDWDLLGRRLLTEGMAVLVVLGVGSFLGPRLLGFAALPQFKPLETKPAASRPPLLTGRAAAAYASAGLLILASLVLEYGFAVPAMAFVRAAVATVSVMATLEPWRLPATRTTLAFCVWSAHWLLLVGLWLVAAAPAIRVDVLHVAFMGGFTLLILAVGMRVVLSHGGHGLSHEQRSWPLRVGIATGLFALLARLGAAWAQDTYFEHLAIAAAAWLAGLVFWGAYVVRFIAGGPAPARKG